MDLYVGRIGVPADPIANQWKIYHAGRISYPSFKIAAGFLYATAVLTFVTRIIIRLCSRRRLFLDDAFLLLSLICLSAATGLVFVGSKSIYISEALNFDPSVVVSIDDLMGLIDSMALIDSFLVLAWTATFTVKFSFLALFRLLIRRVSKRLTTYFWFVVVFTGITWAFLVSEPFILCPYFGMETTKCLPEPPRILTLSLTISITILDICTDIMIISIPVILLQSSQIRGAQKVSLGVFLCLSIFMAIAAITRVAGYRLHGILDLTWQIFWQYMEACVAVIMGSSTAFRTLFTHSNSRVSDEEKHDVSSKMRKWLLRKTKSSRSSEPEQGEVDRGFLPEVPLATFNGIRSFIRKHNPSAVSAASMQSDSDSFGKDELHSLVVSTKKDHIYVTDRVELHSSRVSLELIS